VLYINVPLEQWEPIAKAGAFEMYTPGRYQTWMHSSEIEETGIQMDLV